MKAYSYPIEEGRAIGLFENGQHINTYVFDFENGGELDYMNYLQNLKDHGPVESVFIVDEK